MKRIVLFIIALVAVILFFALPKMHRNQIAEEKCEKIIELLEASTGDSSYDRRYTAYKGDLTFHPSSSFNKEKAFQTMLKIQEIFEDMEPEYREEDGTFSKEMQFYRWYYEGMEYRYIIRCDKYPLQGVERVSFYWHKMKN